jgi:hypothetical protein
MCLVSTNISLFVFGPSCFVLVPAKFVPLEIGSYALIFNLVDHIHETIDIYTITLNIDSERHNLQV